MRRYMIATALLCLFSATPAILAQDCQREEVRFIEVNGYAKMDVTPDEIYLSISINESDFSKKDNIQNIEKDMVRTLEKIGIDKKYLVVKDLGSNFKKYIVRRNEVSQSKDYELKTTSAVQAAKAILALEAIGISNTSVERVACSKIEQYKDDVRVRAIREAKRKAELLTGAIDSKVGKPITITEQDYGGARYDNVLPMMRSKAVDLAVTEDSFEVADIEFANMAIESRVHVKFMIL